MAKVHPKLIEMLVCPLTKQPLILKGNELISPAARLAYPIRNGIPIMLADEARVIDECSSQPKRRKKIQHV